MSKNYDVLLKILLLGDSGVGKTSLICRYVDDDVRATHVATIGIDFKLKTVDVGDKRVRMQIWDTAGQERFETLTTQYYRKAQGILLVYDVTSGRSFKNVRRWLASIEENASQNIKRLIVGNKSDMLVGREVTVKQGKQLASEYKLPFMEVSALKNTNVSEAFGALAGLVVNQQSGTEPAKQVERRETIQLQPQSSKDEGGCSC
ncbi:ras-related protein Rab-13-like [Corticium candelabrum]|uniref:ras-related protein Rab-13-like n=1 Tax=Corticium candelabrum TaxID=121492 RepID=UPI002E2732D8|nr:ras-related protein Rab-13-like [Corticium candelabrum]